MSNTTRRGFSLLDVIILVAILAALGIILLPTIHRMRESAQRGETQNNLRRCAIGVHNWHGLFKRIPTAAWRGGIYFHDGEERTLWFQILPFIPQDANDRFDVVYKDNVHNAVISAFMTRDDGSKENKAGKINFAANLRIFGYETLTAKVANNAVDPKTGNPTGQSLAGKVAGKMKSGLTLARIADGTSNVIMLSTRYRDCGSPVQSTYYSAAPNGDILAGGGESPASASRKPARAASSGQARTTRRRATRSTRCTRRCRRSTSASRTMRCSGTRSTTRASAWRWSNASVRTISAKMSPTTFCRALCPGDGFPLGDDWGN